MRAHRRPRPCSGRRPKCHGSARCAQWPTSTAKSLLTTPFPKPHVRRSVGARAEGAWRVWEGLSSGWGTSDLYQTPQKAISVFFVPPPDILGVIGRVNAITTQPAFDGLTILLILVAFAGAFLYFMWLERGQAPPMYPMGVGRATQKVVHARLPTS